MPFALAANSFHVADWLVLGGYLALLVFTGWWFSRRELKTTGEYFLAGRRMPMWAVSVSIIATSLSAATFVGAPEQSYTGDLTYLSTNIGGLIAVVIVAYFFIPAFYRHNCTTVYELLERRFGESSKHATSAAFMIGRLFASGARIFIGAIPLSMILFGKDAPTDPNYAWMMIAAIAALTIVGTLYTLSGGISSVIWTDVIQTVVLVIAVLAAIIVLLVKIDMPMGAMVEQLTNKPLGPDKLNIIDVGLEPAKPNLGFNPAANFTLLTAIFGFALLNLAAYGTDHDMVQRMLTCKNAIQGGRSVLVSIAIGVPLVLAFLVVGLLLHVFYNSTAWNPLKTESGMSPGTWTAPASKDVFIHFILTEMPPGLRALMLAGLFAAGVGSLTSAINAMAATSVSDFYKRLVPSRGEQHYLAAGRFAVLAWGAALGSFAVLCFFWQRSDPTTTLIGLALSVMTFAYAGLLAVFLTALFTKRGSARSVIAALITGFVVIALLQNWAWPRWTPYVPLIGADLASIKLAFPWHMTIGTTLAFLVCVAGKADSRARSIRGALSASEGATYHCSQCGYDLTGNTAPRCPECAAPTAEKTDITPISSASPKPAPPPA